MDELSSDISRFAESLGIETCREFDPGLLVPEQRIRDLCHEDKCGKYGKHYMCPPLVGTLDEFRARIGEFRRGVLLQYSERLDVRNDREGVMRTKLDFHQRVLEFEEMLGQKGIMPVWGFIGGSCDLCQPCEAAINKPCPHLEKARMSLESIAVDVIALLDRFGLDSRFHHDRIIWTGCVLF